MNGLRNHLEKIALLSNQQYALPNLLEGRIVVRMQIGSDGSIIENRVINSSLNFTLFDSTIVNELSKCEFEKMDTTEDTTEVILPFSFNQSFYEMEDTQNAQTGKDQNSSRYALILLSLTLSTIVLITSIRRINSSPY